MCTDKELSLKDTYDILCECIKDIPKDKAIIIHRFIDKLADSSSFSLKVSDIFNKCKKDDLIGYVDQIRLKETVEFATDWKLIWNSNSYDLYYDNKLFLEELDQRLAIKVIRDINVAFLIRNSRIRKSTLD